MTRARIRRVLIYPAYGKATLGAIGNCWKLLGEYYVSLWCYRLCVFIGSGPLANPQILCSESLSTIMAQQMKYQMLWYKPWALIDDYSEAMGK